MNIRIFWVLCLGLLCLGGCHQPSLNQQASTNHRTELQQKSLKTIHPTLTPNWTTENLLMPESVIFVKGEPDYLLVSLIDGDPTQKDSKGGIAKVGLDGKILEANWFNGLNAPKGMAIYDNQLWVSDIDHLLVIDLQSKKLVRSISILGSTFLNDVTIDKEGKVYVSDSFTHTIYRVANDNLEIYARDIQSANGLLATDSGLIAAAHNKLLLIDEKKRILPITQHLYPEADGIQQWSADTYLVSSWKGKLYLVDHEGNDHLLWDAKAEDAYTADILFVREKNLLLIPGLFNNRLRAYHIQ